MLMQEHKFKGKQTLDIFDRTLPVSFTGNKTQQSFLQNQNRRIPIAGILNETSASMRWKAEEIKVLKELQK